MDEGTTDSKPGDKETREVDQTFNKRVTHSIIQGSGGLHVCILSFLTLPGTEWRGRAGASWELVMLVVLAWRGTRGPPCTNITHINTHHHKVTSGS